MASDALSASALGKLHDALTGYVDRGDVPGLVALVARGDSVHVETLGAKAFDSDDEMQRDTIFRMASMTKPITAVATLMLVEEGRFGLDDPVEDYLPVLENRRVLASIDAALDDTVAAERPFTVRDCLQFTLGFGVVLAEAGAYPIQRAVAERRLGGDGPPQPALAPAPDEWLARFAELPLMHQPGATFSYHTGSDILGVLIAEVTGSTLEEFFAARIFTPLGMPDTSFTIPETKLDRLATSYAVDPDTGALVLFDDVIDSQWRRPAFESGGGGLVSTLDDFFVFTRLLLAGGAPLLPDRVVEAMTTNQLTPSQRPGVDPFVGGAGGWGFGVAVQSDRYGWNGGLGTTWWTYPELDLVAILLTQKSVFPMGDPLHLEFATLARAAADA